MSRYAEWTEVTVEKSKAEIEGLLRRYGATGFLYGWNEGSAVIGRNFSDVGRGQR
jgi:hypothetical protein